MRADDLRADSRIAEAKKLILDAVKEHQEGLSLKKGPGDDWAKRAEKARGAPLFFPFIGSGIGKGSLVELSDGSVKYDFINGIGAHFGHSTMIEAGLSAAIDDTIMQGNLQQNREQVTLMERMVELSGLDHCFLTTSGAMACENALKIAFQKSGKSRLLAFRHCFMGRTCLLANITDKPAYREGLPHIIDVDYVPFGPEGVPILEKYLKEHSYAAMTFELIQGEGGINVGEKEWLEAMMKLLKKAGVIVIVDEVQTFGRTTEPFAFQHFGLQEYVDIVTVGKMTEVCATLFKKELAPKPGLLSQTFTASTSAIYAAHAILDHLKGHFGPHGRNAQVHAYFEKRLKKLPQISGPFGLGLMIAFQAKNTLQLVRELFDAGVMSLPASERVRFLVPPCVTFEEIDAVCDILEDVLC